MAGAVLSGRLSPLRSLKIDAALYMVFPPDTSDDAIKLAEVVENLHRAELTSDEQITHTGLHAELLKRIWLKQRDHAPEIQRLEFS